MVRWHLAVIALAGGCAFDAGGVAGDPVVRPDGGGDVDEPDATAGRRCPDDPQLVACYRFEAGAQPSQPHDDSGHQNHGTSSGVHFVAGRDGRGQAMAFAPGATALVPDSPSLDVTAGLTLELWVWVDRLPPIGDRAGLVDNNGQYGMFLAPNSQVRCVVGSATAIGLTIPIEAWTHVACTYDGTTIQLYQAGAAGPFLNASNQLRTTGVDGLGLGQDVPSGDHLDGALDDVRVWGRPLSADEICAQAGC
jgi:hypothetical protein